MYLLFDVKFAEQILIFLLAFFVEDIPVLDPQLSDMGEPSLERPMVALNKGCSDSSASVVSSDDDIFDF